MKLLPGVIAVIATFVFIFYRRAAEEASLPEVVEVVPEVSVVSYFVPLGDGEPTLADLINQPDRNALDDVTVIKQIFSRYRNVYKGNPVGDHVQILRRLTGDNAHGVAYIPPQHPAIINGQLHDRWGMPFYFHQISREVMEVRSAGPDGRHWNSDDVVIR